MFGWFKRRPARLRGLDELLAQIEADLVRLVPAAASAAAVPGPAYGVFLYYDDNTVGFEDLGLTVVVAADEARRRTITLRGPEVASRFIWVPLIELGRYGPLIGTRPLDDHDFLLRLKAAYLLMIKAAPEDADDEAWLRPLRECLWRAARALNARDWRDELRPTDDFVVVTAEAHGVTAEEDVVQCLLPAQRALLESRRLLFHTPSDADRAAERRAVERVEAQLAYRPVPQQAGFWVRQLAALADGKPNLLAERGWSVAFALGRLSRLGPAAAGPLLDLAASLDRRPAREAGVPTLAAEVASAAVAAVGDLEPAAPETERKLRELLAESCRRNEGRERWSDVPFRCAYALAKLFQGYPWPSRDFNDVLVGADAYLSAPMGSRPRS